MLTSIACATAVTSHSSCTFSGAGGSREHGCREGGMTKIFVFNKLIGFLPRSSFSIVTRPKRRAAVPIIDPFENYKRERYSWNSGRMLKSQSQRTETTDEKAASVPRAANDTTIYFWLPRAAAFLEGYTTNLYSTVNIIVRSRMVLVGWTTSVTDPALQTSKNDTYVVLKMSHTIEVGCSSNCDGSAVIRHHVMPCA